jgi:iron complex outermembrane receptor protein
VSAAALAAATLAQAQAAPSGSASHVEEVVVTAQRRAQNSQEVPVTIQALSAATIQKLGIKSSTDISQYTPNVDIALPAGEGNQPIVTIRGIGLNDYDSNNSGPNGVYVDEVYLSAPASQTFQTFDLERIEVLKGPQGTLYGRNTSGGAINFITAKPTDTPEGDFHLSYGSFNTINLEAAIGGPIAPGLDGRIALVTNQSDGYMHNGLTGTQENGQNNVAGRAMLQWKPRSDLTVLLNLHAGYVDNRPTEYRHVGTIDPTTGAECSNANILGGKCVDLFGYGTPNKFYEGDYNRREHLRVKDFGGYLRFDYTPGAITYTSLTAFTHSDRYHPEDSDASPDRLLEITYGAQSNTVTQEFRASQSTDKYNWVGGFYYLYEALGQNQPLDSLLDIDSIFGPGAGDGLATIFTDRSHQDTTSYAVYGQGDYHLTNALTLTLGGRYSYEEKSFVYNSGETIQEGGENNFAPTVYNPQVNESLSDGAFNYRAALNYKFTEGVRAYGSIATGFKSGGFNGGFLSSDPAEITTQLKPVRPEHVTSYEVGLKTDLLDRRLRIDLAAFYNDYQDMQVFTQINSPVFGNPPLNVLDNAPKAHTQGIDLSIIGKPFGNLTITENLGLLQTRLDQYTVTRDPSTPDFSGNRLPLSPTVSSSTILDYSQPAPGGDVDVQLSFNYKSKQFFDTSNDPLTTQAGYWIENARVAYSFKDAHWEVAAYVHNLSGEKYLIDAFDLSSPFGLIEDVVGRPRELGVELNYRY